jgi:hypothetical protein
MNNVAPTSLLFNDYNAANQMILPISKPAPAVQSNGLVDILPHNNVEMMVAMQERINLKNKANTYSHALQGIWEDNSLAQLFFNETNINFLQEEIRRQVRQRSGGRYILPKPSVDQLQIIMRAQVLQYARYVPDVNKEKDELNQRVLKFCVDQLIGHSISYERFLMDQSTLVQPLQHPSMADRDSKQAEFKPFF